MKQSDRVYKLMIYWKYPTQKNKLFINQTINMKFVSAVTSTWSQSNSDRLCELVQMIHRKDPSQKMNQTYSYSNVTCNKVYLKG